MTTTIESLRRLVLSAVEVKSLTQWPDTMVEDYLNIIENIILIAETLDDVLVNKIEDIATDFSNGSIPFANGGYLTEDNSELYFSAINERLGLGTTSPQEKLHVLGSIISSELSSNTLVATDSNKKLISAGSISDSINDSWFFAQEF